VTRSWSAMHAYSARRRTDRRPLLAQCRRCVRTALKTSTSLEVFDLPLGFFLGNSIFFLNLPSLDVVMTRAAIDIVIG
jgi:hypothetical protein